MYEIGVGIDFYLEYFKFSPEFKATLIVRYVGKEEITFTAVQ